MPSNKTIVIISVIVGILLIGGLFIFSGNKEEIKKEDIKEGKIVTVGSQLTGIELKEMSLENTAEKNKENISKNFEIRSEFTNVQNGIQEDIYVKNKGQAGKYNFSKLIEIDYDTIRWGGKRYNLDNGTYRFVGMVNAETGEYNIPNIFFDDKFHKRINYRDVADVGGYALAYKKDGKYYVELKIDNLDIPANKEIKIDPTYTNQTNGFDWATINPSGSPGYMAVNSTDMYMTGFGGNFLYHLNEDGTNLTDGADLLVSGADAAMGVCFSRDGVSLRVLSGGDGNIYNISVDGTNLSGAFDIYANSVGNPSGLGCNNSDFWFADTDRGYINHYNSAGVNQTNGIVKALFSPGTTSLRGLVFNTSDLYILSSASHFIWDIYIPTMTNTTEGFTTSPFGIDNGHGLSTNDTVFKDLWLADTTDNFVYHITGNQIVPLTGAPEVTLDFPANNSQYIEQNATFNCTARDNSQIKNISLYINGVRNYTIFDGVDNESNLTVKINGFAEGIYFWTCMAYDDGSHSITGLPNRTMSVSGFKLNTISYNTTTFELYKENFKLNISTMKLITSAKLNYNGTNYTAVVTQNDVNTSIISANITNSEDKTGNHTFYFTFNLAGNQYNTSKTYDQFANFTTFSICNSTVFTKYLNVSFKDETDLSFINASASDITWHYWYGDKDVNKTYTLSNASVNYDYTFCSIPNTTELNYQGSMNYYNPTHPTRKSSLSGILNRTLTNVILYLLETADGVYENVQVINSAEQPLSGVAVLVARLIGDTYVTMGSGTTGDSGVVTFFLNPIYLHLVNASKTGYPTASLTFYPTGSGITLTMGTNESTIPNDYTKGISYTIKPTTKYLNNDSMYHLNFTISTTFWDLNGFGFNITDNNSRLVINKSSSIASGGTIDAYINTSDNSTFKMTYFWEVNETQIIGSTSWLIIDLGENTWSISYLIDDFVTYVGSGMFGMTSFGVGIICFFAIFIITGVLGMKFGITDPATILGVVFGLVLFFDVGIGLLPNPVGAIPHFPTIFIGIILTGLIIKEASP